jgi:hypothetical protein
MSNSDMPNGEAQRRQNMDLTAPIPDEIKTIAICIEVVSHGHAVIIDSYQLGEISTSNSHIGKGIVRETKSINDVGRWAGIGWQLHSSQRFHHDY